ncbi:hypothetical protein [Aeromonas hydrophila]|uniref:hypothetical protein n=1 Tax=Aeromonas hydrophila TaxID=644 RepID=UPI0023600289|nr:hypothetical protein [Aeromonas hydrophila]
MTEIHNWLEGGRQIFGSVTHFMINGFSPWAFIILVAVVVPISIWIFVEVSHWVRNQENTKS